LLEKDLADNYAHIVRYDGIVDKARAVLDLALPQAADAKSKLTFTQGKQEESEHQINPYREQLLKLRKQQAALEREIVALEKSAADLEQLILHTRFWVKGFKDVRLYIIDEVLQELELTTNAMLEEVGLVGWAVQYDIEKETKSGTITRGLNVSIVSPASKSPAKWEAWSGGEGQRLRLVGALALSDCLLNFAGVSTDLEILDEPTRHLSGSGVRDLCEWLAIRAKQLGRRTFFVDHYAVDATYFASTFTVVKDADGSHMERRQ
jgi:DNA repair exonuclease SbcCD ATPase subunit